MPGASTYSTSPSNTARSGVRIDNWKWLATASDSRLHLLGRLGHSTPEAGLGLVVSFKSVHFGEEQDGDADFTHNLKRNEEELRVEATAHHLRQPYAVMAAVVFLPFESCHDHDREKDDDTSSIASWVEFPWPLKGRNEPEDPPDQFEMVFVGLYARNGSEFGFYEVGGPMK